MSFSPSFQAGTPTNQPASGTAPQLGGAVPSQAAVATQQTQAKVNDKPSLTGVRIKQRKRQAQASAKFEPEGELGQMAKWYNRKEQRRLRTADSR